MMPQPDAASVAPQAAPPAASPTQGMDALLTALVRLKASDLHLSAGCVPTVRLDGEMTPVPGAPVIGPADTERLLLSIAPPRAREEFARRHDTDFAYEIAGVGRGFDNPFASRKGPGGDFASAELTGHGTAHPRRKGAGAVSGEPAAVERAFTEPGLC